MESENSKDDMTLPKGKTCGDCAHVYRCTTIFGAKVENRECDFYPVRFVAKNMEVVKEKMACQHKWNEETGYCEHCFDNVHSIRKTVEKLLLEPYQYEAMIHELCEKIELARSLIVSYIKQNNDLRADYKSLLEAYNSQIPGNDAKDTINRLTVRWGEVVRELTETDKEKTRLLNLCADQGLELKKKAELLEALKNLKASFEGKVRDCAEYKSYKEAQRAIQKAGGRP
jgi:hypothetical protein